MQCHFSRLNVYQSHTSGFVTQLPPMMSSVGWQFKGTEDLIRSEKINTVVSRRILICIYYKRFYLM